MDLPDCPPGAEGYEDTVTEMPMRKPNLEDEKPCNKAEQEFQDHVLSLKVKLDNGQERCIVECHGRDASGKLIYLCFPCGATCAGESVFQTHIMGKKHKNRLDSNQVWPAKIFDEHPYILVENGNKNNDKNKSNETKLSEREAKYEECRNVRCHIQDTIDGLKVPVLGAEYLVEFPPEEEHHEPSYLCTLCLKHGHPRTIMNHMTSFAHKCSYLARHFPKAYSTLSGYKGQKQYRNGVMVIMNRLCQRIEDTFGRKDPLHFQRELYDKEKEHIHQWIFNGNHPSEKSGNTFEEVCDIDLLKSLKATDGDDAVVDPSPPVVPPPTKPTFKPFSRSATRQERRGGSLESLSDISDDENKPDTNTGPTRHKLEVKQRYAPYEQRRDAPRSAGISDPKKLDSNKGKAANYTHKLQMANKFREEAEESAKKALQYHEKNPEKHPLYPEEWKKFWNKRYKEIQAAGQDPSKHDFKPEWIVYWTARMKELHDTELRVSVEEVYRKLRLTPPVMGRVEENRKPENQVSTDLRHRSPERRRSSRRSPIPKRRSPELRRSPPRPYERSSSPKRLPSKRLRSPEVRRRSPDMRRRSPDMRRRSPDIKRRSPDIRRRSPDMRRRSPEMRRRSPELRRRSPISRRRSPEPKPIERRRSPIPRYRSDLRRTSPNVRKSPNMRKSPSFRHRSPQGIREHRRSPHRTHIKLDSMKRSRSPLSLREEALRNKSPVPPGVVMVSDVSDDELKPDNTAASPWNSDMDSLGSLPETRSPTTRSRGGSGSIQSGPEPRDLGPAENVVATLRLLVALEDYLGSLGPKIVDLLTEALKMEKEEANSSEEMLERESALVLMETAKEKLKGAMQAGLVPAATVGAVRAAVVRAAATLHEADNRARKKKHEAKKTLQSKQQETPLPVAGVGEVNREEIARQMAAALVAQGKTDVTAAELQQLVDAVVGMAEAKKREAAEKKKEEAKIVEIIDKPLQVTSGGSALALLQSAYDENDKRADKDDIPEAMDRLSDSDLETLLKNFNELSAEEQHSLIAYLKKLEAKEPHRVEKLRQYVNAAAVETDVKVKPPEETVTVPSDDDDDYTVEEVFQSATQKVMDNQKRQEMEIVKKSLEKSPTEPMPKTEPLIPKPAPLLSKPALDLINMSSATDLLALVQASLQSTPAPSSVSQASNLLTGTSQPRSFGDSVERPLINNDSNYNNQNNQLHQQPSFNQQNYPPHSQNDSYGQEQPNDVYDNSNNMTVWESNRNMLPTDNRGPLPDNRGPLPDNRGPLPDNRGFSLDNRGPLPDNRGPLLDTRVPPPDNRGNLLDNRGLPPDNRGPSYDNRGPLHDNRGLPHDNRVPPLDNRGPPLDNRGHPPDNRGPPRPEFNNYNQDRNYRNQGEQMNFNPSTRGNFMNGRMQNNFAIRPNMNQQQQFGGNFNNKQGPQQPFRGRGGRGYAGQRGRGRGRN